MSASPQATEPVAIRIVRSMASRRAPGRVNGQPCGRDLGLTVGRVLDAVSPRPSASVRSIRSSSSESIMLKR